MKTKLLRIEFQSDWHIGTGAGIPGSVDRQVLRDPQGLPYVPGKTLTGILRDAAEFVADIRGGSVKDLPSKIFGSQPESESRAVSAKIGISSAEFPKEIRDYILSNDLTSSLFYVQPGIKINIETGCTEKDNLFSLEKVRRGCVLYAEVVFMEELSGDEMNLLNDAVKAVRRIGGKRRRGAGLCKLSWASDDINEQRLSGGVLLQNLDLDSSLMLKVRLTNLQPLIIAIKALGNMVQSETEIPGYMLLSYYVNKVFAPLGKERMQKAVMNNEIIISNFLPELEGHEALPVPLCMAEKKESKGLINRLVTEAAGNEQIQDIRSGYVRVQPGEVIYYSAGIRKGIRTHNTIEDISQRPDETTGGLFTYESIDAGQKFIGILKIAKSLLNDIMQSDEKENIFAALSRDIHKIGRSSKDEYGKIMIETLSQVETENNTSGLFSLLNGKYLVLYLKSDLLLKNGYNGYSARLDDVKKALCEKLGVILEDIPQNEWEEKSNGRISPIGGTRGHCIRTGRRDSWQTVWTLPRPSLIYFREGSIFMFKVADPEHWSSEKAKSLIQSGLGERLAEGYGQVMINPDFICNPDEKLSRAENLDTAVPKRNIIKRNIIIEESYAEFLNDLKKDTVRRHFRQTARREAYSIIWEDSQKPFVNYPGVSCSKNGRPSASQFGALREAVSGGQNIFVKWVELINKESSNKDTWNEYWCSMLRDLAEHPDIFVNLRPAFADFNVEADTAAELLGIFLDLLCEAVFDDEKSMKGAVNE